MLDIGGWELLVVAAVALIVVGPKELPGLVRAVGRWVARARNLAREFQSGMEAAAEDVDMEEFRKIGSVKSDLEKQVRDIGRSAQRMVDDVEEDAPRNGAAGRRRESADRIEPDFDPDGPRPTSRYASDRREQARDAAGEGTTQRAPDDPFGARDALDSRDERSA
ncbi:MAG: Sec-independent protein translocase protein TatB [Pseudomonadota bacterium]